MKTIYSTVAAGLTALVLSGCGMQRTSEAIHDEVKRSNEKQDAMLDSLRRTQEAIHLQILTVAMEQMFNPVNTVNLRPPVRMMPFAETFAAEATEDELIRTAHVLLQDAINTTAERKRSGEISLTGFSALAGLAPDDKVRKILSRQIDGHGRFEDTACVLALARYGFIRDFLFRPALEAKTLNRGVLVDSVNHFRDLREITKLPYVSRLELEIPVLSVKDKLDTGELALLGRRAKRKFTHLRGGQPPPDLARLLKQFDI